MNAAIALSNHAFTLRERNRFDTKPYLKYRIAGWASRTTLSDTVADGLSQEGTDCQQGCECGAKQSSRQMPDTLANRGENN
eukprot:1569862-Prymnesium_polylepis.1